MAYVGFLKKELTKSMIYVIILSYSISKNLGKIQKYSC